MHCICRWSLRCSPVMVYRSNWSHSVAAVPHPTQTERVRLYERFWNIRLYRQQYLFFARTSVPCLASYAKKRRIKSLMVDPALKMLREDSIFKSVLSIGAVIYSYCNPEDLFSSVNIIYNVWSQEEFDRSLKKCPLNDTCCALYSFIRWVPFSQSSVQLNLPFCILRC